MKMTLSSPSNVSSNERSTNSDNRSLSPNSSPRSSPRPSPRPQSRRDHSKSDTHLSVNYKEQSFKHEGSPSSQDGSVSGRSSNIDVSPTISDLKSESTQSIIKDKKDGRSKKKSSWFNSFYPTYKSRSEDFKKLFKEVPDDERLVVDYSCALQKEILMHGRLYVTQNYLCFYANIFGWETNLTLKWKDVAAITKEKTALVIPNAVLICTKSDKYFFTSFVARDKTYLMLFRVWQNALMDQPMSAQEMWQWVHQCYGDELGLTSDDEDYIAPATEEEKLSARLSLESFSEDCISTVEGISEQIIMDEKEDDSKQSPNSNSNNEHPKKTYSDSQIPTDVTDNSESDAEQNLKTPESPFVELPQSLPLPDIQSSPEFIPEQTKNHKKSPLKYHPPTPDSDDSAIVSEGTKTEIFVRCSSAHEGRQVMQEMLPIHIDQLFTLLFTNSKFYLDFHASRKTTDLTQTPWTHNPLDNSKNRVVNLTLALSQTMGPKTAQVTETQVMLPCSKAGYIYAIDVETINAGVPYADSFCVLVHYCLQKISETQSSLTIFAQIKYKKSVWGFVKGMIERNCWSGLDDFFTHLSKSLRTESEECIPEIKRKSRRKRKSYAISRSSIEEPTIRVPNRKKVQSGGFFHSDITTLIVFPMLLLVLILNVLLYYKLWSLEEVQPYSVRDLHVLQNPPKTHDEWIKLLQQQETLHTIEAHKWQRVLKTSIKLLRQAEESLNELQRSIHPTYTNKIISILRNQNEASSSFSGNQRADDKEEL